MPHETPRPQIAELVAQLIYTGRETDYQIAKRKVARRLGIDPRRRPGDIPTNAEIRNHLQRLESLDADSRNPGACDAPSVYDHYRRLLAPLEAVVLNPHTHPEGDALYHSLQVFSLTRNARPWDVELQLAALLHDVGQAINPANPVAAALEVLDGLVSPRTAWFIAHHQQSHDLREGVLGHRAARALRAHADFDELLVLADCDSRGRQPGADVPTLSEALTHIADLDNGHEPYLADP